MMNASELLHKKQLKATPLREAVLGILMHSETGLSLQDLSRSVEVSFNRSSLFRTLQTFEGKGLLHKITHYGGSPIYAFGKEETHRQKGRHAHFFCVRCKNLFCLDYSVNLSAIKVPQGFEKDFVEMQVTGICDDCRQKQRRQKKKKT